MTQFVNSCQGQRYIRRYFCRIPLRTVCVACACAPTDRAQTCRLQTRYPQAHRLQAHMMKAHGAPLDVNVVELHGSTALVEAARNGDAAVRTTRMR